MTRTTWVLLGAFLIIAAVDWVAVARGSKALMVLAAFGTGDPRALAGAALFAGSDSLITWQRCLTHRPWMPVSVNRDTPSDLRRSISSLGSHSDLGAHLARTFIGA